MAPADMRGFRYPLEPLAKRREWQLDAALATLAGLRERLAQSRQKLQALEQESAAQARLAADAWARRSDPGTQRHVLGYLAQLHGRREQLALEIRSLQQSVAQAQEQAVLRQQALEAMNRHRADAASSYRVDRARLAAAQADQDWTARNGVRAESPT